MLTVFLLLIIFQIKHFLADYPFQTEYMLGKFKPAPDYALPLLAHASVHAVLTFGICLLFSTPLILACFLGLLDLSMHAGMDRVKASPELLGRYKPLTAKTFPTATAQEKQHNKYFWWSLGLDQMVHHLTHYFIIAILVLA